MNLNIIKYKHHGYTINGGEKAQNIKDLFYWSFFELSNRKVISLLLTETFKDNKLIHSDLNCHYTECYKFGDDFFVWFDKISSSTERNLEDLTKEEDKLVKKFFRKHIEKTREVTTEIIYL